MFVISCDGTIPCALNFYFIENIMNIMKIVVPVCLLLMTSCLATENTKTTELEQQLKVHKREKQYLIEDDPNENEGPEQKRDERQSTPVKNNHNLDSKGNSRIINIRLQPAPKQAIKPNVLQKSTNRHMDTTPQRIPTKIPVILKTAKVIPGPAHAIRLKMLENQINESKSNYNKENTLCPNAPAPTTLMKDSIPYFTIEDKATRKTESRSSPNNVDDEKPNLESNATLNRDGKKNSGNDGHSLNNDGNDSLNKGKDDQVTSSPDRKAALRKNKENSATSETVQKPVDFYVDEPEPLPPLFRSQQKSENIASQSKEVTTNKMKEIPIAKKGNNKPKKGETKKKENENDDEANDADVVRISNGTHIISIKKIRNNDKYKIERLGSRDEEENTVPTEERIVNQEPPKPAADEPEKHSFSVTENSNIGKEKTVGSTGLAFRDKIKEEKDKNDCITITNHNYKEFEEKSPILPPITLQPANPSTLNEGNQESWNCLQNPYYNPYYQNIYDQYRKNYGLAQVNPNIYGQEIIDPYRNYGVQMNPYIYSPPNNDPYATEITLPYYPNGKPPTDTDSTQYPYAYENQPEIENTPCPLRSEILPDISPENALDRIWRAWKDVEVKNRKAQTNDTELPLDIDIRRNFDDKFDGNKVDMIGKVANPYATSSLLNNLNGAVVYPYVNPGYRYMR